jgi:preprotein translocase subunit SecY
MQVSERLQGGDPIQTLGVIFLVAVMIAIIALIVYVESARRNIAISYASRRVGSQVFRGQETSLPLKINMGGVIPVIFASSVLAMPQTILSALPPDPNNPNTPHGQKFIRFSTVSRRRSVLRIRFHQFDRSVHVLSISRSF